MSYLSRYNDPEVAITVISNTSSATAKGITTPVTSTITFNGLASSLSLSKVVVNGPNFYNGDTVEYTITLAHNAGSDDATAVVVSDTLPVQLKNVTATSTLGTPTVTGDNTTGFVAGLSLATFTTTQTAIITIKGTLAI